MWNATFVEYLTDELSGPLGCSFELYPLASVDNAYELVATNQTDFLFISSGQMHCIEVSQVPLLLPSVHPEVSQTVSVVVKQIVSGISPVASLVNWVGGKETSVYGGCIFVRSNRTDITSLKQLVNASVSTLILRP